MIRLGINKDYEKLDNTNLISWLSSYGTNDELLSLVIEFSNQQVETDGFLKDWIEDHNGNKEWYILIVAKEVVDEN